MKKFLETDRVDANIGPADGGDAFAISEKAKRQIGSQASASKTRLQGPNFFEGFSDGPPASSNAVNVATVHWKL
jgi:hypothetical protein